VRRPRALGGSKCRPGRVRRRDAEPGCARGRARYRRAQPRRAHGGPPSSLLVGRDGAGGPPRSRPSGRASLTHRRRSSGNAVTRPATTSPAPPPYRFVRPPLPGDTWPRPRLQLPRAARCLRLAGGQTRASSARWRRTRATRMAPPGAGACLTDRAQRPSLLAFPGRERPLHYPGGLPTPSRHAPRPGPPPHSPGAARPVQRFEQTLERSPLRDHPRRAAPARRPANPMADRSTPPPPQETP